MPELSHIAIPQFAPVQDTFVDRILQLPHAPDRTVYTVYAKATSAAPGSRRVGFALSEYATEWFTRGIRWRFDEDQSEYSLFVRFVLLDGIERLEYPVTPGVPSPWFALPEPATKDEPVTQLCCAPPLAHQTTRYHFRARLAGGGDIDPIIVVTPINGKGDGDGDGDGDGEHAEMSAPCGATTETARVEAPIDELLLLGEGAAFTIEVKISNDGPMFSLPPSPIDPDPPDFPGGVQWGASKAAPAATLTFQFPLDEILKLQSASPGLSFSLVAIHNGIGTQTCHLSAPAQTQTFDFDVLTPGGDVIEGVYDPIIVVTPINGRITP